MSCYSFFWMNIFWYDRIVYLASLHHRGNTDYWQRNLTGVFAYLIDNQAPSWYDKMVISLKKEFKQFFPCDNRIE
jgi:hypothetical protein